MACCALAAFLISQIIFGLDWARERLGLAEPARAAANSVVAWRLDGAGAALAQAPATAWPRHPERAATGARLRLAAVGGGVAFALLAGLTLRVDAASHAWGAVSLICTGHGLERLASLRGG